MRGVGDGEPAGGDEMNTLSDAERVDELVLKHLDGVATVSESEMLRTALEDPTGREAAVKALVLTAQLMRIGRMQAARAGTARAAAGPARLALFASALAAAAALLVFAGRLALRGPAEGPPRPALASVRGRVEIAGASGSREATPGTSLCPGETLRTGADSSARLLYDDGSSLELGERSEASLAPAGIRLAVGSLRGDVVRRDATRELVVTTPHAEARILGTLFKIEVHGDSTRLDVEIGRVRLVRTQDGESVDVGDGEMAVAAPGVELVARAIFGAGADGRALYVDNNHPAADDANTGESDRPLRTISKAVELVQPGDRVIIRPGVYREGIALTKGGTKEKPVVIQAEKPGTVVVTGADPLKGWTREPGDAPVYSVSWPHDFIINTNPDGSKVRNHGADAPIGCAEQVIWDSRPLAQVMSRAAMRPGTFFVDWDRDRLYVWLPGGLDPNATQVLGSTRSTQLERGGPWGNWAKPEHVHVKGIIFRYAANFAQRGGVKAWNGWRIEDCTVEWNNGGGLGIDGDDVVILRVTSQDNGFSGIGGGGRNGLVKDCVVRRNNRKGFPVGWDGGGGKFCGTEGLRIVNHTSYDNTGPGIWLDWDNRNYVIEYCTCYANHGNQHAWEGMGIFTEANDGQGRIVNNVVYSNTGSGIEIAESQHVLVEGNVLVDNGAHIGLRAMEGRAHHKLEDVTIRGNRFKQWRGAAIATSLGRWGPGSVSERKLAIDGNIYDPPEGKPLIAWGGQKLGTLEEVRSVLRLEEKGSVQRIPFAKELVRTEVRNKRKELANIAKALADARPGDTVALPVNGRTAVSLVAGRWTCQVYDLDNTYVTLELSDAGVRREVEKIDPWPRSEPVYVKTRMTRIAPDAMEGVAVGVSREAPQAPSGGSAAPAPYPLAASAKDSAWRQLDLSAVANRPLVGEDAWIGIPLSDMEPGVQKIHGVPFSIMPGAKAGGMAAVALRSAKVKATRGRPLPVEAELRVGRRARAVYFLHGAGWAAEHSAAARYEFIYADGSKASIDIVPYGRGEAPRNEALARESNIQDWWPDFPQFENENARAFPVGDDDSRRYLYTLQWVNPTPAKVLDRIRLASNPERDATVVVLAVTVLE